MPGIIVGIISTHNEGRLVHGAVRSLLAGCDTVIVADGPVLAAKGTRTGGRTDWSPFKKDQRVTVLNGTWPSDAGKRTFLLDRVRQRKARWAFTLDADELLVWGEYLPDIVEWLEDSERETGKPSVFTSLRNVELDGSVASVGCRLVNVDHVKAYLHSGFHFLLANGVEVSRPNIPLVVGDQVMPPMKDVIQARPPLQGEPHILHRSALRDPGRKVDRLHKTEADDFDRMAAETGAVSPASVAAPSGGVPIWLPDHLIKKT